MSTKASHASNAAHDVKHYTKKLGRNGPEVSSIGYGCMGLSGAHGKQKPDEERFAILDHVYQSGSLLWDSADVYGDNEELLGRYAFPFAATSKE